MVHLSLCQTFASYCLTEPGWYLRQLTTVMSLCVDCRVFATVGAGSDATALVTSARRDGDSYVLNGTKVQCLYWMVGQ